MKALVTATLLLPCTVMACLQVDIGRSGNMRAHLAQNGKALISELRHAMQVDVRQRRASDQFGRGTTKAQIKQVDAIDLIYRGNYQAALKLLHEVEGESPGRRDTAFNLGTAYELSGDDLNALKWITEGVRRNRHALGGTEWLHIAILQAKIEAAKRPDRGLTRHIISMQDTLTEDSEIKVGVHNYWAPSVSAALYHQLRERLEFVKPKDPLVADLLYSYALLEGRLGTQGNELALDNAVALLRLAGEYGFPDEALRQGHEDKYWFMALKARLLRWLKWSPVVLLVLLLPVWLTLQSRQKESRIYWAWRWFRSFRSADTVVKLDGGNG